MRIVLVDSSRTVLHIVTDLLTAAGHAVHAFTDAPAALDFLQHDASVRTLITSAAPVGMSGVALCSEARKFAGTRRPLYIVLMSSLDDRELVVRALDSGADDFVRKPPAAEELTARLRAAERLTTMQVELIKLANTDPLTRLQNRRAFFERAREIAATVSATASASAIMIDVDHFKTINDTHGHDAGDEVLRAVAARIDAVGAAAGRLGGEEFCLVTLARLPGATAIAHALRQSINELDIQTARALLRVTCSFGIAEWQPGESADQVLRRADFALYQAKAAGRDRVVVADATAPPPDVEWTSIARRRAERSVRHLPAGPVSA